MDPSTRLDLPLRNCSFGRQLDESSRRGLSQPYSSYHLHSFAWRKHPGEDSGLGAIKSHWIIDLIQRREYIYGGWLSCFFLSCLVANHISTMFLPYSSLLVNMGLNQIPRRELWEMNLILSFMSIFCLLLHVCTSFKNHGVLRGQLPQCPEKVHCELNSRPFL